MKYSVSGSNEICPWITAAKRGGSLPENPLPGEPRIYNVDAWLEVDGRAYNVTNKWLSELPEELKKPFLKELGLPVKKGIVYKDLSGVSETVADIKISDVWDGWCNLVVKLGTGVIPQTRIHSMHFAEMNSGIVDGDPTSARKRQGRKKEVSSKRAEKVKGMPLDFVVVDLESTDMSYKTSEICEIAALKVADGEVVDRFESLVFIDREISPGAARKNHISKDMLEDAPHMTKALKDLIGFIGNDAALVGHNIKTFDLPFLKKVAEDCGLDFLYREAIDTCTLAKRAWPGLPSYKMDDLRVKLDLDMDGSHRALKDCYDEYELYMTLRKEAAEGKVSVEPPKKTPSRSGVKWSGKWQRKKAKEFVPQVSTFDPSHPLFDKFVVISGDDIAGRGFDTCMQAVCDCGGHPQDNITKKTDLLVMGKGAGKSKLKKAEEYQAKGIPIVVVDETQFASMAGWEND